MKYTLAITNYNRCDLLLKSFKQVIADDRISEIVIVDDCSDEEVYYDVKKEVDKIPKVIMYRNEINLGMQRNKYKAISLSTNDWVIILDSDNIITPDYINAIERINDLQADTIYCPEDALPNFRFGQFKSLVIDKFNISSYIDKPFFGTLENTCNYLVHKKTYLWNYRQNDDVKGVDTHWHLYNHIKNYGKLYVVPGCWYMHRVHDGSEWLKNAAYNMSKAKEIDDLIKQLSNEHSFSNQ